MQLVLFTSVDIVNACRDFEAFLRRLLNSSWPEIAKSNQTQVVSSRRDDVAIDPVGDLRENAELISLGLLCPKMDVFRSQRHASWTWQFSWTW